MQSALEPHIAVRRRNPGTKGGHHSRCLRPLETPLGAMLAGASDEGLELLAFADQPNLESLLARLARDMGGGFERGDHPILDQLQIELEEYFNGPRKAFEVPLQLRGSDFQRAVWHGLAEIPWGQTESYGALAARVGFPGASRAVGSANGDNRLAIVLPCHRVLRADGGLSGYAGGVWRKRRLLELEQDRA